MILYVARRSLRAWLLCLAAVGSAAGQKDLFDLATTGDGGTAYFASTLARGDLGETAPPDGGRIFRIGPPGLELYLERARVNPPPITGPGQIGFTNYFDFSRPQSSRDGSVVAVVGHRLCFGGGGRCAGEPTLQTTVTGLPGGTLDVAGAGRLSGSGRYLMIYGDGSVLGCTYVVDLQAGPLTPPAQCHTPNVDTLGGGKTVADNGTAVVANGPALYFIRGQEETQGPNRSGSGYPGEAVIDAAASVVVYSMYDWSTSRLSIRIYRIAEQSDSVLATLPGADSHTPYLSADARRVMFLSDASGLAQIYTVDTNGGDPRQVTHDPTGVLSAAMSDDGKVAWYFSGAGRLYRLDLDSGDSQEQLGRTPQIDMFLPPGSAGSLYTIPGAGFGDQVYLAESFPLPRSLGGVSVSVNGVDSPLFSVSPTQIMLQIPFEAQGPGTSVEVRAESSSPFVPRTSFETTVGAFAKFLPNLPSPSAYGGFAALAAHEDWSGLVTSASPALPGEIVHLYGTGFGSVDSQPPDGMPAPADPPARTVAPVTCWSWGAGNLTRLDIQVPYAGLAPGFAGVCQLDARVPASNLRPSVQLNCAGDGDNSNFIGSFAVKP